MGAQQNQEWAQQSRPREEQAWEGRQQENEPSRLEVTMDCSSPEGKEGTRCEGLLRYQEGHSSVQQGQVILQMKALAKGYKPRASGANDVQIFSAAYFLAWFVSCF